METEIPDWARPRASELPVPDWARPTTETAAPSSAVTPSAPAGGPSYRGRQAVEMAQRLFGEAPPATEPAPSPEQRLGRRAAEGAIYGAAAPEIAALMGRGLSVIPYAPAKMAGAGLTAAAPLMGIGSRAIGSLFGAGGGAAGETATQAAENRGVSPAVASLIGSGVEMATGAPASAAGLARRALRPPPVTPPSVSGIRSTAREAADIAAEELQQASTGLRREQLQRDITSRRLSRDPARQPATTSANEAAALKESKLAAPDTAEALARGTDVDSQIRQRAIASERSAEATQAGVGGQAFEEYKAAASELQDVLPFSASPEGASLRQWFNRQIQGGEGSLRAISGEERRGLMKIQEELFPKIKDIDEARYAGNPGALERARAAAAAEAKPPSFELVEREIRRLRDIGNRGVALGFNSVQQAEAKQAADVLEGALNGWLARGNAGVRPREAYAKASEPLNRFRTELGQALTTRQEVPFASETQAPGAFSTAQQRLSGIVFRDADNVRFSRQLLGASFVDDLAERHASNQLRGLNADKVTEWLRNPSNAFVDAVPGLREKLTKYGTSLAQREGNSAALTRLQDQLRSQQQTSREGTRAAVATLDKQRQDIINAINLFERAPPENLIGAWNSTRRVFEGTGKFTPRELDEIGERVAAASRAKNRQEQSSIIRETMGNALKKFAKGSAWGGAAYGLYETVFGGRR